MYTDVLTFCGSSGLLLGIWERARRGRGKSPASDDLSWRRYMGNCLELCDEFSTGNLLVLYLHHRSTTLESMTSGDANKCSLLGVASQHATWKRIVCKVF